MARDDRMARVWSPGTNVTATGIVNGGYSEIGLAPSAALLLAQDRIIRDWTVTRVVGNMQLRVGNTGDEATVYVGIRVANENEVAGNIGPGTEQTADWMYWQGINVNRNYGSHEPVQINIDNRSQRKSRGMESVLVLYTFNAGPDQVYMWWSGRTLLLIP